MAMARSKLDANVPSRLVPELGIEPDRAEEAVWVRGHRSGDGFTRGVYRVVVELHRGDERRSDVARHLGEQSVVDAVLVVVADDVVEGSTGRVGTRLRGEQARDRRIRGRGAFLDIPEVGPVIDLFGAALDLLRDVDYELLDHCRTADGLLHP